MPTTLQLFNRSRENGKPETLYFQTSPGCMPSNGSISAQPGIAPVLVQVQGERAAIVFSNQPLTEADVPAESAS